jgi:hypothetical protein
VRAVVLLGLLGCSAGPPAADLGAPDLSAVEPPDLSAAADCRDDAGERARGGTCLRSVSGQVVDEQGGPVRDLVVTVCAEQCFYGKTSADGRFTVEVGAYLRVERYAVLLHGQPRRAAYYLPLPAPRDERVELPAALPLLPMPTEGPLIARDGTAQTLRAGGVTLTIAAGTDVFLSPEDAAEDLGRRLRPLLVPWAARPPFLAGQGQPAEALLYAFGPFEIGFSKPARLSVDNGAGLPAGAAVEWLAPRGLLSQPPPAGRVEVVGQGRVSADGARVELDGEGLTALSWLLVRAKGN